MLTRAFVPVVLCAQLAGGQRVMLPNQSPPVVPLIVTQARLDPGAGADFHAMIVPDTVYVGQQATYQIAVFLDDEVRTRLRRNPEFVPPELRSIIAYDLPGNSTRVFRREAGGRRYEVHVFERALFPLAPGRLAIPPAQLAYSLPLSASFFSREETFTLRSEGASLYARQVPTEGRPAEFDGAVGNFSLDARVDSAAGRVGDPFVLTVAVAGAGNVNLLPRPHLVVSWASVVPSTERVTVDLAAPRVSGRKEFDWIITPKKTGTLDFGDVRYAYFNPDADRYEFAVVRPPALTVQDGTLANVDSATDSPASLPIRTRYAGEVGSPLAERRPFWAFLLVAPAPALLIAFTGRKRRPRVVPRGRMALRRLSRGKASSAAAVRRAFIEALDDRISVGSDAVTRRGALARSLRLSGVPPTDAAEADALLVELDNAVFSSAGASAPGDTAKRALDIACKVDKGAIARAALHSSGITLLLLLVAASSLVAIDRASDETRVREQFERGVALYRAHEFSGAARLFGELTRDVPRAPDVWANLGTAGWASGDSAVAAVGWQRALRLEPRGDDTRERLTLLATPEPSSEALVPLVTASETDVVAAMAWFALWLALAGHVRRRQRMQSPVGTAALVALLVACAGTAAGAFHVHGVRSGRGLAVLVHGDALRADPAIGGETAALAVTGEVAHVNGRRGAWTNVRLGEGRAGWIESERLVPLADNAP